MTTIRPMEKTDWVAVWSIIAPVFRAGDTYAFSPDITEDEAFHCWVTQPSSTYVSRDGDGNITGTYYIKPNQPAMGAHVCNCGYIVAQWARGQGIASSLCEDSQKQARALGFRAMQYNLVVSTNESAIRLWKRHGFVIIGTLPGAFRHPKLGFVDAHIMYKTLPPWTPPGHWRKRLKGAEPFNQIMRSICAEATASSCM